MIKINLLESITDKPIGATTIVERKVSSPVSRLIVLAAVVGFLTVLAVGFDYLTATMAQAATQKELDDQKQIAIQMEAVIKEQADLEARIKSIDDRIGAIKQLRASQAGPSAVLDALSERIAAASGLYLQSVEQKGDQLTIVGNSPNEEVVTQFGRSLEFSNGLFTNLGIETTRKEIEATQVSSAPGSPAGIEQKKPETVNFTIRCVYSPSKAAPAGTQQATNGQPGAPPQANNGQVPPAPAAGQPGPPTQQPPAQVAQK